MGQVEGCSYCMNKTVNEMTHKGISAVDTAPDGMQKKTRCLPVKCTCYIMFRLKRTHNTQKILYAEETV